MKFAATNVREKIGAEKSAPRWRLTEGGGGSKAIWAMTMWKQHISTRGFPDRRSCKIFDQFHIWSGWSAFCDEIVYFEIKKKYCKVYE